MRQILAAIALSAAAIAAMLGAIGPAGAADMPAGQGYVPAMPYGPACAPRETVVLFTTEGVLLPYLVPTVPARTPYFYCVTGTTLIPGDIPPPPEYCCG